MRRRVKASCVATAFFISILAATAAAQVPSAFPYDRDLVLDAPPMRGSKRVPVLEIASDGRAQIDLWCKRGTGQAAVTDATIGITLGTMNDEPCTAERMQADEEMIAALAQVTGWRLQGNVVTLTGATTLRFRLATN
jgi:heat shock protein HslJ